MQHSEHINELAMALSKAQSEMEEARMNSKNPYFKSEYADLTSIWKAAKGALAKNGLCVIQTTDHVGDSMVLVTMLAHSSGQFVKGCMKLSVAKAGMQELGSAITYARRYSLGAIIGMVNEGDDDDGEKAMDGIERKPPVKEKTIATTVNAADTPRITPEQYAQFRAKLTEIPASVALHMGPYFRKNSIEDESKMPVANWSYLMNVMANAINAAKTGGKP